MYVSNNTTEMNFNPDSNVFFIFFEIKQLKLLTNKKLKIMEMYKEAAQLRLRITTTKGPLSVEQLFEVDKETLIIAEETLTDQVEKLGKRSRRVTANKGKDAELLKLKLAIVSDVLDTIETEEADQRDEASKRANNKKIIELIAAKKEAKLGEKTIEELEAMLQ